VLVEAADILDASGTQFVAFMPESTLEQGHVPGSRRFDWEEFDLVVTTDRETVGQWVFDAASKIGSTGISPAKPVVLYDEGSQFSARGWWILDFLGFDQKSVLNGGIDAWSAAGGELETGPAITTMIAALPIDASRTRWESIALLLDVAAAVDDRESILLDVRSPDEYRKGHIPGAVNIPYQQNADRSNPGYWKSQDDLLEMYAATGITPDRRVIPYCSTGVRSAVTWFTLRVLGFNDTSLFTGSWREWNTHPELPVTIGSEP
jgi:thiosulfate/3-mercaptopyruvate sulfurtransferase